MVFSEVVCLSRAGTDVHRFALGGRSLEIGSDPDCDIAVHASGVPRRALLVVPRGGSAYVYDLARAPGLSKGAVMPLDREIRIGGGYAVTRRKGAVRDRGPERTELLDPSGPAQRAIALVQGRGREARAYRIPTTPVSIGAASDNAVVLSDRAVSQFHCRIEPSDCSVSVRDLGSTNGTWVDGAQVQKGALRVGSILRVGRTELRVASRAASPLSSTPVVASSTMLSTMAEVDRFARLPWPALIRGETGVGKELIARALHERGPRAGGPFVALNGGGLPSELIESELFGHERGSFTGAIQSRRGAFEQAHEGTLFLDEIAELAPALQTRLLRILETWHVRRVGSESPRAVDVRLICATHKDLKKMVERNEFRADLYYRIHRLVVEVPPLRQRVGDIAPLAEHFLASMEPVVGPKELSSEAVWRLRAYAWPGNVRELRNALELAAANADGATVDSFAVDHALRQLAHPGSRPPTESLRSTLEAHGGNLTAAARALGIPRSTFRDRLRDASVPDVAR